MFAAPGLVDLVAFLFTFVLYVAVFRKWAMRSHVLVHIVGAAGLALIQPVDVFTGVGTITIGKTVMAVVLFWDVGRHASHEGGIPLLDPNWMKIWATRFQAYRIVKMIPEDQWRDLREEVNALAWTHLPELLRDQRQLDAQAREMARVIGRHASPPPAGGLRAQLHERAKAGQKRIDALRLENEERIEEITDLIEGLPPDLYLARRESRTAEEVRTRCTAVIASIEHNRQTRLELDGPTAEAPAPPPIDPTDRS